MREFTFSDQDLKAIATGRYHHPHPHVQRKMEVLWLKSHGLPHRQIAELAGVSLRTAQRYLGEYLQGGLKQVHRCNWRGPKSALLRHERSVEEYFWDHPPSSTKEAAKVIFEQTGLRRGLTQVRAFLKTHLGLRAIARCRPSRCRLGRPSKNTPASRPASSTRSWSRPFRRRVPAAAPCTSSTRPTSSGRHSWAACGAWP